MMESFEYASSQDMLTAINTINSTNVFFAANQCWEPHYKFDSATLYTPMTFTCFQDHSLKSIYETQKFGHNSFLAKPGILYCFPLFIVQPAPLDIVLHTHRASCMDQLAFCMDRYSIGSLQF